MLSKCEWRKRLEPPATAARAEALWPSQADGRSAGQWPLRREAPPPTGSASSRKVSLVSSLFTLAANTCMVAWAAVSFSPFPLFLPLLPSLACTSAAQGFFALLARLAREKSNRPVVREVVSERSLAGWGNGEAQLRNQARVPFLTWKRKATFQPAPGTKQDLSLGVCLGKLDD